MTRPVFWRWADGRFCARSSSRESVTCLRADVNREQQKSCVDHERRDENGNGDGDSLGCLCSAVGGGSDVRGRWSCVLGRLPVVVLLTWRQCVVLVA